MIDSGIKERIKDSIIAAIRSTGNRAYVVSLMNCPVKTGYLKSTGNYGGIDNGCVIVYLADYSSFVHNGTKPGIRTVKSYVRRDGALVKEHSYYSNGQKSQPWIKNAIDKTFDDDFQDNVYGHLITNGFRVQR